MEPIGHVQWTIGITLIVAAVLRIEITGIQLFWLGWMSVFPDLIDLLWGKSGFQKWHRFVTHGVFFLAFWYLLAFLTGNVFVWLTAIGSTFHIAEDLLAGGMYVELLTPLSKTTGRVMFLSKAGQARIGRFMKDTMGRHILGTKSLSDELAFFWLVTLVGSWLFIGGVILYYVQVVA